jgi:hypothetical protein
MSAQVLLSLGFGGSESLSKIPDRFLTHRSRAKGVTITGFVKKEEDLVNRCSEQRTNWGSARGHQV